VRDFVAFVLPPWALCVGMLGAAYCTPSPVNPPPDGPPPAPAIDGGSIHYTCHLDGSVMWTCQDGLTTPIGTCAHYGCVPVP